MTQDQVVITTAHHNREDTLKVKWQVEYGFVELSRLLSECHKMAYWKLLGYDTFEAYLADPELSVKRSTAYNLIALYDKFVAKMGQDPKLLAEIGSSKLTAIAPVVDTDPDEWLEKAKSLGKMDLINEVRNAQGKQDIERRATKDRTAAGWVDFEGFKKSVGCAACGDMAVEKAHYPVGRGAGGDEEAWIPLCHKCHMELHSMGIDSWTACNKHGLWRWVHSTIERAYSIGMDGHR